MTPALPCKISTAETTMSWRTGDGSATEAAMLARVTGRDWKGCCAMGFAEARGTRMLSWGRFPHVAYVRHPHSPWLPHCLGGGQRCSLLAGGTEPCRR